MDSCQVHLAADTGQVNRNKHLVKTLFQLEGVYLDGLTMTVKL